jgi:hypothetical protein
MYPPGKLNITVKCIEAYASIKNVLYHIPASSKTPMTALPESGTVVPKYVVII